ncbi:MAG: hypothetical protein AB1753_07285 [Thermoproteota archaeon]
MKNDKGNQSKRLRVLLSALAAALILSSALALSLPAGPFFARSAFAAPAADNSSGDGGGDGGGKMTTMMMMAEEKEERMTEKGKSQLLRGSISSVQPGGDGSPEWIQSGTWVLRLTDDGRGGAVAFSARINMVAVDGTSAHRHTITKFVADSGSNVSEKGNRLVLEGRAAVSTKDGIADGVPLTITVSNRAVIAIVIDKSALSGHFGSTPIYGTVSQPRHDGSSGSMMTSAAATMMMMEGKKLTRTSVPLTIPLTRGYAGGHEVFYISTEASDRELAAHLTRVTGFRVAYAPSLASAPAGSLANIYAFSNGIEGGGPLGFQPNVADSEPGDSKYSPLWRVNTVEWNAGTTPRELKSEAEVLDASSRGEVKVTSTEMVVNCPFVQWGEGESLKVREDKKLSDDAPYGGGQVLAIDTAGKMQVTFVAHRGFAPDGSTIYYIATDASVKEVADALGVVYVEKTGAALVSGASSDLWVFTNGIKGTGPMGFQASIAGSNVGDDLYSPLWRILATTWSDAGQARFLTTAQQVSAAAEAGRLTTEIAGVVVNCPFVEA